jgi:pilus assembly protein Flp/PilA
MNDFTRVSEGEVAMLFELSSLKFALRKALTREDGQDLVEYALIVALIALAATAGMNTLAQDLSSAFSSIGTSVTNNI